MTQPTQTTLQCSSCGTPNQAVIRRVIDAQQDPQGKALLVSGQINSFQCQSCGTVNTVSSPLLYHDAASELLVAFVPMDVAMQRGMNQNEEQVIGSMMNELTQAIPKEQFKAYMFNPKRALTLKGLIEQVMEADGITPEMIEEQKQRVELVQTFIEAGSEEAIIDLIKEQDEQIDAVFFQTLMMMAQRLMQQGQQQIAGHLMAIQQVIVEHSSYGAEIVAQEAQQQEAVAAVTQQIEALGEGATREDFIKLAISLGDDDMALQAMVSLIRPAFDYEFFEKFTAHISQAPADERANLETVRDKLNELGQAVDEQTRQMVQQKAQFIQMLLGTPQYEQMMRENVELLDDNFMTILTMNLQEAERRGDQQAFGRIKTLYDKAVEILQEQMTPELRFLNELLSTDDDASMQSLISENIENFNGDMLEVVDAVEQMLVSQGREDILGKLGEVRSALQHALS